MSEQTNPIDQAGADAIAQALANALDERDKKNAPPPAGVDPAEHMKAAEKAEEELKAKMQEYVEEGDVVGAMALMRQQGLQDIVAAQNSPQSAEMARTIYELKNADEFGKWWPKVEAECKERGVDPNSMNTPEKIKEAIGFVKGKNIHLIEEETEQQIRERVLAEAAEAQTIQNRRRALARGSRGKTGEAPPELPYGMSESEVTDKHIQAAKDLRVPLRSYLKNMKEMEPYDTGYGAIRKVPLFQEDVDNTDEYGDTVVRRGAL